MKYLFFDTETNGLPKNYNAEAYDIENWPRMLQLAFAVFNENGEKEHERSYLIKPNGFDVDKEAGKVHGLTAERMSDGIPVEDVILLFNVRLIAADVLIAHNINFDQAVIGAEMIRTGLPEFYELIKDKEKICTMNATTEFCKIPGPYGFKWPKLQELHHKLFGENFENAHDALVDVTAMAKCFFELKRLNIITTKQ